MRSKLIPAYLCLFGFWVTGCQHQVKPPPAVPVVTAAPRQPSAKATLADARRISVEADRRTDTARGQVDVSVENVTRYRDAEYMELHRMVLHAQAKGFVSSEELSEIIARVLGQKPQLDRLLTRLKQIQDELNLSQELRRQIDEKLAETLARVAAKDTEAEQLRQQLADQQQTSKALEENAQANMQIAVKSKSEAAHMRGQRDLTIKVLAGVSILALVSLIGNYLQFKRGILPI